MCCISFDSYIKPQPLPPVLSLPSRCISFDSYIKPQLAILTNRQQLSCISFDSYIKPQLVFVTFPSSVSCISFDSYIKPQRVWRIIYKKIVVYLLIPTSNHNSWCYDQNVVMLYIFWFLHQTTTEQYAVADVGMLYIFWFLHQTTTRLRCTDTELSCISFDSYIKPQQ